MRRLDLAGRRFGRLIALRVARRTGGRILWVCQCVCGKQTTIRAAHLTGGRTVSCGCFAREHAAVVNRTHGMTRHRVYAIWNTMNQRCHNPRSTGYYKYGARGVRVCRRWRAGFADSFQHFVRDMGLPPSARHSIERTNNGANYTPNNCVWVLPCAQARNTRRNIWVVFRGRRCLLLDLIDERGLRASKVRQRLARGWSVVRALRA